MARHLNRRHYDRITVVIAGIPGSLHSQTIRRFLPRLWEEAYPCISGGYLEPETYGDFDYPCRQSALHMIYDHLKDSESGPGRSIALTESLDKVWLRSRHGGSRSTLNRFKALCYIFGHFGCNQELFKIMESFFIGHSKSIMNARSAEWVEYINALDGICNNRAKELTMALGHVLRYRTFDLHYLDHLRRQRKMHPEVVYLLEALLEKKVKRMSRKFTERAGSDLILRGGGNGALEYHRRGHRGHDYDGERLHYMVDFERDRLKVLPPRRMPVLLGHYEGCPLSSNSSVGSDMGYQEDSPFHDHPDSYLIDGIPHRGQAIEDDRGLGSHFGHGEPLYSPRRLGIME